MNTANPALAPAGTSAGPPGRAGSAVPAGPALPGSGGRILLAAGVTVLMWSSAFVVVRLIGDAFSPGAIALGRQLIATLVLTVVVTLRARRRRTGPAVPRGRLLLAVLGWGVLWFGLYNLSFNTAERHLDAGTTSFLVNLSPILVAVLAGVLLREGFPARLVIGLVIALAGVGGIAAAGATGQGSVLGVVLGVTSAVLYAFGAISQKRILRSVDALTMTWLGSAASVLVLLPFAGQLLSQAADASVDQIALVAYLGLGPTVVGFLAWAFVLARVSAGRTASTTYVVPVVVLVMAWAVLGEVPPLGAVAGGTLALLGVAVSTAPLPHGRRKGGDTA